MMEVEGWNLMRGHQEVIAEVTWIAGKSRVFLCGKPNIEKLEPGTSWT
jgi:hypothetical protein